MKLHCIELYNQYMFENTPDHTISKGYSTDNFQIRPYTRLTEEEYLSIKDQPDFLAKVKPQPQLGKDHQPFRIRVMIRPLSAPVHVTFQMETRRIHYEFTAPVDDEQKKALVKELKEIEIIINQNWAAFTDYSNDKALYAIYDQK